ncbi:hypothetical protein [Microvirga flavescens]|uniref:hypothetical protein n=1 Tax=Microvirga flavescens TaxID=2249811 RepID=UPI001300773C|nr:hypothetical protein [Microvirga flavescens]
MMGLGRKASVGAVALAMAALGGCGAPGEGGSTLGNMVLFAGTTVPEPLPPTIEDVYCPPVSVIEGGSALQAYTGGRVGDASGLRSQISLSQMARECAGRPDGSTVVKIGAQGRALLGAGGGSGGRFDVPLRIIVKSGSSVFADRVVRGTATIPAGDTLGTFTIIEDGIVVPAASAHDFTIDIGLGSAGSARPARRG